MKEPKVCPVCRDICSENGDVVFTDAGIPWAMHMEYDIDHYQLWHTKCWDRAAMLVGVDNTEAWRAA